MEVLEKSTVRGLSEAHMRALERIEEPGLREAAAVEMAYMGLPPEAAEAYVDAVLAPRVPVRFRKFLMAVESSLPDGAEYTREDADNCVKITVRMQY